jgi:hypothetical protein
LYTPDARNPKSTVIRDIPAGAWLPSYTHCWVSFRDGTCFRGTWDYARPRYCYHWEGEGTVCFRHVRSGSSALVIQQADDGSNSGFLQLMTEVSDAPLACGPPLIGQVGPTVRMAGGS